MLSRAKILTLNLAVLLVGGAIGATAAQAVEFHTEGSEEKTTITGSELESFLVTVNAGPTVCIKNSFQAVMSGKTASSLAVTPTFGECALSPPSMGGCGFVLHASGAFGIEGATCAAEPVQVKRGNCTISFGPQKVLTGVSYANEGKGAERDVKATIKAANLHYTQMGGITCIGGQGTFVNGKISFIATLRADNAEGKQKGLWVE